MMNTDKIKQLEEVLKIQCDDGNWNYDPYMQGMANGLILAHSIISGVEPHFKEAPKEWLYKKHIIQVEAVSDGGTSEVEDYNRAMEIVK